MNRRQFLKTFGVGIVTATPLIGALAALPKGTLTPTLTTPESHAIARLTFGVTPGLFTRVHSIGAQAFIAEQLQPEALDDSAVEQMLQPYSDILDQNGGVLSKQGTPRGAARHSLTGAQVVHATFSTRQLQERMAQFFSNHFYTYLEKSGVVYLKVDDERDVIRPNAMTSFGKLLHASAHSPAMLVFLDNAESTLDIPNENYARELMELHTLSVNGGYTETDVKQVARCFTGWSISRPRDNRDGSVYFSFRQNIHDDGGKQVLGTIIPAGGGEQDGEQVLDLLAGHPSTAHFISTKIARRFVSDEPPAELIDQLTATYRRSGGDIHAILTALFASDQFWGAPPKFKQPFEYVISVMRALNVRVVNDERFVRAITNTLDGLGQVPFEWPTPNGYPDTQDEWLDGLLMRWNFALAAVSNQLPGAQMDFAPILDLMQAHQVEMRTDDVLAFMGTYLLGRALTSAEQQVVVDFAHSTSDDLPTQVAAGTALLLSSPAFQYR